MDATARSQHFVYTDWTLIETQFDPSQLNHKETVFTIGNGYLSTRGSFEEGYPRAVPATFIHGVYNTVPVVYTELANCPDWLPLVILVDGERFRLDQGEVLSYERQLDLRRGLLSRSLRWRSPDGKTVDLYFERFASLADEHVLGLRFQILPLDFEGEIEVQTSLNGYPDNQGFNHWEWLDQGSNSTSIWLQVRTRNSRIELGAAARLTVSGVEATLQASRVPGYPTLTATFQAVPNQKVTLEKMVAVVTSRDVAEPTEAARKHLQGTPDYLTVLRTHEQKWEAIWAQSDILIEGDVKAQFAVRYNLFQLLICAPHHDDRVSIPAKALSGFGYRGHIFWDTEIFILPFFTFTQPELACNLLTYRYRTLNGARRKAENDGYKGAMFPWESADTGDEVTPRWLLPNQPYGEDMRIWFRDREIHISADVAYAVWYYWQSTGDDEWMRDRGAEIILDTAVFWSSRIELNTRKERYEIHEVIGADEYHEHVSNNAFTNRMAQWHLEKALAVYDWLRGRFPEQADYLEAHLNLSLERRLRWHDIVENLWIPYDPETGLIEQHEDFFKLKDVNLADYEPRTCSIQSILGIDETNKCQVMKQPDVLMLLYLMRGGQEFPYSPETLKRNWDYYAPRTDITYGSSLGPAIHAILASDLNLTTEAYEHFLQAVLVDLEDSRGNAHQGIHAAAAGGVWQAVVLGFGGIQFGPKKPIAKPHLPPSWRRLKFKLHWRDSWHEFDLSAESADAESAESTVSELSTANPKLVMTESTNHTTASSNPLDLQGVIFDLDGVLTDTAEFHYRSWQKLADEEGIPFDRQANEAIRGVSRRESLLHIIGDREFPEAQLQEMMERKNNYYKEFIKDMTPSDLLPGALPLLKELQQAGIKMAIGSGSKNAQEVVRRLGIGDKVDAIADGHSVTKSKPAPDLFLCAAQKIGIAPEHCVVFEDAASGVEAALAAGMCAVGLGPTERVGAAHVVVQTLDGVTWTDLKGQLQRAAKG